jgi:hypothetical protein
MFLLLTGISVLARPAMARQDDLDPSIRNESSLHPAPAGAAPRIDDVVGATTCSGTLDNPDILRKIGLSPADLIRPAGRTGVQCTVGDFDGNGYLDFALWGFDGQRRTRRYLVLFFEKDKLIRSTLIEGHQVGRLLVHYPPRKQAGEHGEPVSAHDGLFEIGETNDYDDVTKGTVYLFDSRTGTFSQVKFGEEK